MSAPQDSVILHASCVAINDRAILILGPSGAGKSSLALQLMAFGADLVADDRTEIRVENGVAIASSPSSLFGLIEARGIGILRTTARARAPLSLVVDLGQIETDRLPSQRHVSIVGVRIDLVLGPLSDHFSAAVLCYLKGQRQE